MSSFKPARYSKKLSTRPTESDPADSSSRREDGFVDLAFHEQLKKELRESQEMVQDLQNIIKVNKEALQVYFNPDCEDKDKLLLENYRDENDRLLLMILKLFMKNQYFIKNNYVEKKLNEEDTRRHASIPVEDDTVALKLKELQEIINNKDISLNKLNRNVIQENEQAGQAIRNREVMKPTECNTIFNKAFEEQKERMGLYKRRIEKLIVEKKELLKINFNCSSEILKMKAILSTSTGYHNYMSMNKELIPENLKMNFDEQIKKIMDFHQKYIQTNKYDIYGEENLDSGGESDYSDEGYNNDDNVHEKPVVNSKVPPLGLGNAGEKNGLSSNKPKIPPLGGGMGIPALNINQVTDGNEPAPKKTKPFIPPFGGGGVNNLHQNSEQLEEHRGSPTNPKKLALAIENKGPLKMTLDLTKAKQIQEDVAKKVMEKYMEKHKVSDVNKEVRLEEEMQRTKKVLLHEMTENKLLNEHNNEMKSLNNKLIRINDVLVKANKRLTIQYKHSSENQDFFRQSHELFTFLINNLSEYKTETSLGLLKERQRRCHAGEVLYDKDRLKFRKNILENDLNTFKESLVPESSKNICLGNGSIILGLGDLIENLKREVNSLPIFQNQSNLLTRKSSIGTFRVKSNSVCGFDTNMWISDVKEYSEEDDYFEKELQFLNEHDDNTRNNIRNTTNQHQQRYTFSGCNHLKILIE